MKKIILSTLIFLGSSFTFLYSQWEKIELPFGISVRDLHCLDENTAIAVAWKGQMMKTTDGGITWIEQGCGTENHLYSITCTDNNTCYVIGDDATFIKTEDGGNNWTKNPLPEETSGKKIYFYNDNLGFITGGASGYILRTEDAGTNWESVYLNYGGGISSVFFTNENTGFALGQEWNRETKQNRTSILKTEDGGENWTIIKTTELDQLINGLWFTDESTGFVVGSTGLIMRTTDSGNSWDVQNSGVQYNLRAVQFTDSNNGYAVGDRGTILKTANRGNTWLSVNNIETTMRFNNLCFFNTSFGYISTSGNIIFNTSEGGL